MRMLEQGDLLLAGGLFLILLISSGADNRDCRHFFNSTTANKSGTFNSTSWPGLYPLNSNCRYYFVGLHSERVELNITDFQLQGVYPQCQFDYLDIYADLSSLDPEAQISSPLLGRFCGDRMDILPSRIISTTNVILISFHSDGHRSARGFYGSYRFIDASIYEIGTKSPDHYCQFTIQSTYERRGQIVSPTYPGVYPDNLNCSYGLHGVAGERIQIVFNDFSLFHGGDYCPYDSLTVYDGGTRHAPVLGKFCGEHGPVTFFSSGAHLFIEFVTRAGRIGDASNQYDSSVDYKFNRRGFNVSFTFRHDLVTIDNHPESQNIHHIRGTACDMRIISNSSRNGTIKSPGYPRDFPVNITCIYYIDGLYSQERLEKVKVKFTDFSIPGSMPECNYGYVAIDEEGRPDARVFKERYCGPYLPPDTSSKNSRLVLIFNTDNAREGRGFSALYEFIPDYGIPGENVEEGQCTYLYASKSDKSGTFNSPHHPLRYPDNTRCRYIFRPEPGERILISFYTFFLGTKDTACENNDYLEIFHSGPTAGDRYSIKHCGRQFPGPILADRQIEIKFISRRNSKNSTGFEARFEFVHPDSLHTNCGGKILSPGTGGIIVSPGFPDKYNSRTFCRWTIKASSPFNDLLVYFYVFHTEGTVSSDDTTTSNYGCQNAVLRLYRGNPRYPTMYVEAPEEKCGQLNGEPFLSNNDTFELEFLTSSRALGAKGFKITWTEVHKEGVSCEYFRCSKSEYCIHSELACNRVPNCGRGDNSDEEEGCPTPFPKRGESASGPSVSKFDILHIAIGASISSFFCIVLVICGLYHRRRLSPEQIHRRRRPLPPEQDTVEVRYVAADSSCNTTDRLLQLDHVGLSENGKTTVSSPVTPNQTKKSLPDSTRTTPSDTPPPFILKGQTTAEENAEGEGIKTIDTANHHPHTPRIQKVSIV
ncbi:dorsal-ventral patterning tolloid-like protein 1 isoform X4 [Crassostrea virginica]|uniref:Tolloid-like protein 2 isoform X2 n=2 Tax=Crassostrea virginica TaxID=6565 RepID=A0A8B8AEN8_CRAVI|nr:tolloid-like protein 2 isoform X2 [Crassostrea virginica]